MADWWARAFHNIKGLNQVIGFVRAFGGRGEMVRVCGRIWIGRWEEMGMDEWEGEMKRHEKNDWEQASCEARRGEAEAEAGYSVNVKKGTLTQVGKADEKYGRKKQWVVRMGWRLGALEQ